MASPDMAHRRDRRSSSIGRNSSRSYGKVQYDNNYGNRNYNNRARNDRSQVISSNFPHEVSDLEIKDALHHELGKFGDISNIYLRGHDHQRQAFVTFRSDDAARELRRYCLERHCKVIAFQKTLHFDFDVDERGNGSTGGYVRNNDDWDNRGGNRNNYNNRSDGYRNNDRYNGHSGRGDFGGNNNRDRFHDHGNRGEVHRYDINPRATRTLFVGNLDHDITKEELLQVFDRWGEIDDIDVKRPPGGIPAYAFIKYLELDAASTARSQMVGKEINGRQIKVGYGKTLPSTTLWIGGLGGWCNSEMLNREFDRFGALRKIEYMKGNRHAYIEFESIDAANAAYSEMRGFPLGGPDRKIKIDYAEPNRSTNDDRNDSRNNNSRGSNRNEQHRGNHGRERGRGNFDCHKNDNDRDIDVRNDRTRTRSRSPLNKDRSDSKHNSYSKGVSPNERTKCDNVKSTRTHIEPSSNEKDEKAVITNKDSITEEKCDSKPSENLSDVSKRFVVAWRGAFALKNSAFPVRMHLIGGNPELANFFFKGMGPGAGPALKVLSVTQRLRLDPPKLDEVSRRITQVGATGHCVLLALPTGEDIDLDSSFQRRPLKSLVTYFKKKEAAGVIILNTEGPTGKQEESGMLHAFPPCDFSQQQLLKVAPNLTSEPSNEDHLVVIVVKGASA